MGHTVKADSQHLDPVEWLAELHADFEIHKVNYGHSLKQIKLLKDAVDEEDLGLSILKIDGGSTKKLVQHIIFNASKVMTHITDDTDERQTEFFSKWYEALSNIVSYIYFAIVMYYLNALFQIHMTALYDLLQKSSKFHFVYTIYVIIHIHSGHIPSFLPSFMEDIQKSELCLKNFIEIGLKYLKDGLEAVYVEKMLGHFFHDHEHISREDFKYYISLSIAPSSHSETYLLNISEDVYKYYFEKAILSSNTSGDNIAFNSLVIKEVKIKQLHILLKSLNFINYRERI